ncbi:MAG: hypothetical protein D6725_02675, partial [Planctomycetota bacterium]
RAEQAGETFRLSLQRLENLRALPLEAVQGLQLVAEAETAVVLAIAEYNAAQIELERLVGMPLGRLSENDARVPAEGERTTP